MRKVRKIVENISDLSLFSEMFRVTFKLFSVQVMNHLLPTNLKHREFKKINNSFSANVPSIEILPTTSSMRQLCRFRRIQLIIAINNEQSHIDSKMIINEANNINLYI